MRRLALGIVLILLVLIFAGPVLAEGEAVDNAAANKTIKITNQPQNYSILRQKMPNVTIKS